jgi:hypothetical protein
LTPPSSTNARPHEPTFFVDQNLIGEFVAHLRLAGLKVEQLQDHPGPMANQNAPTFAQLTRVFANEDVAREWLEAKRWPTARYALTASP